MVLNEKNRVNYFFVAAAASSIVVLMHQQSEIREGKVVPKAKEDKLKLSVPLFTK